jgi:hypothetical protein
VTARASTGWAGSETSTIPFRQHQEIVIPKGTPVRHRGRVRPAGRTYRIVVDHVLPGSSKAIVCITKEERGRYPKAAHLFAEFDRLREASDSAEGDEAHRLFREAYDMRIPLSSPSVRWAGTGGYWSEAEIDYLLEANGFAPTASPAEQDHGNERNGQM